MSWCMLGRASGRHRAADGGGYRIVRVATSPTRDLPMLARIVDRAGATSARLDSPPGSIREPISTMGRP